MPTILKSGGFRFFFYSADGVEPMHVHVEYADGDAKFWLEPLQLAFSHRMRAQDLKKARLIIEENIKFITEKWNEYFNTK